MRSALAAAARRPRRGLASDTRGVRTQRALARRPSLTSLKPRLLLWPGERLSPSARRGRCNESSPRSSAAVRVARARERGRRPSSPADDASSARRARSPALDGPAFYAALPFRVARELRTLQPDAVLVQGAHETALRSARAAAGRRARPSILDLHGDWRAATRLYGLAVRRLLDPVGDVVSPLRGPPRRRRPDDLRVRRAGSCASSAVEPAAVFPAFVDVGAFPASPPAPLPRAAARALRRRARALQGLRRASRPPGGWSRRACPMRGSAVVGRGSVAHVPARSSRDLPAQTSWTPRCRRHGWPRRSTTRRCSSCPPVPKASAGRDRGVLPRRAPSWEGGPAGSPTSSRTARTGSSSTRGRPEHCSPTPLVRRPRATARSRGAARRGSGARGRAAQLAGQPGGVARAAASRGAASLSPAQPRLLLDFWPCAPSRSSSC